MLGEALERTFEDFALHSLGRMGQQHQPVPGGVQREPAAHPRQHPHRLAAGDPLDVDDLVAFPNPELDVLVGHLVQVLEERQRGLAQRHATRRQGGDLP